MKVKNIIISLALAFTGVTLADSPITAQQVAQLVGMETNNVVGCIPGFSDEYPTVGCVDMGISAPLARLQVDNFVRAFSDVEYLTAWEAAGTNGFVRVASVNGNLFAFIISVFDGRDVTLIVAPEDVL